MRKSAHREEREEHTRSAGADGGVAAEAQAHAEPQRVEGQAAQQDARPCGRKRSRPERQAPGNGEHGPEHAERHGRRGGAERRKGEQLRRDGAPARGDRCEVGETPGSALLVHGEPADDGGHERHEGAEKLDVGVRAQRRVPSGYGEVLAAGKTGCQAADEVHRRERGARQAQGL